MTNHLGFAPEVDLRKFLRNEMDRRRAKNPRYSLRAFARSIGLSHSSLTQIISGRRNLSQKSLELIIERLGIGEKERKVLRTSLRKDPNGFTQVSPEKTSVLTHWYSDAILELFLLEDFEEDPRFIARRLGLKLPVARAALEALIAQGMLTRGPEGRLQPSVFKTTTVGQVKSIAMINQLQCQLLLKQSQAIRRLPAEERSSLGMTIAADPEDLPQVRQEIFDFVNRLNRLLNRKGSRRREVFRLNIGYFPLTRKQEQDPADTGPR